MKSFGKLSSFAQYRRENFAEIISAAVDYLKSPAARNIRYVVAALTSCIARSFSRLFAKYIEINGQGVNPQ